jgi:2-C-methyl-D-erythritol 4-phosphate cytidylyltransferase
VRIALRYNHESVMKVSVILPAAGLGTRMGRTQPEKAGVSRKQFMLLEGLPILVHTIRKFAATRAVSEIVVALRPEDMDWAGDLLRHESYAKPVRMVEGGDSRQQSVENALASLAPDTDLVAVHDAVRPFVEVSAIERVVQEAAETGAAILGIVPVDTVKLVHLNKVRQTLTRERLVLSQTPQVFRYDLLRLAFEKAREDGFTGTDEASLVERLEQVEVSVVAGSERNIKITRPADMDVARLFLQLETAGQLAS